MAKIQSDAEFKTALSRLSTRQQRAVGRLFIQNVIVLSDNPMIGKLLDEDDLAELHDSDIRAMDDSESAKQYALLESFLQTA
jgi:hypothetical protein